MFINWYSKEIFSRNAISNVMDSNNQAVNNTGVVLKRKDGRPFTAEDEVGDMRCGYGLWWMEKNLINFLLSIVQIGVLHSGRKTQLVTYVQYEVDQTDIVHELLTH